MFYSARLEPCLDGTLADLVKGLQRQRQRISAAEVRHFMAQLASALEYIHEQGVWATGMLHVIG